MTRATGHTRDAGWQLGVRRTVAAPADVVWQQLLDVVGVTGRTRGAVFETTTGIRGEVRSYHENELVRLRWGDSVLQLRVMTAATGTTVSVHQEELASAAEREHGLARWTALLDELGSSLNK